MNNHEINWRTKEILKGYLALCKAYCVSDIWIDKEAVIKYQNDGKADQFESPMLMLYEPVYKLSKLCEMIVDGKQDIDNHVIKSIKQKADEIWYAIEQRADVRDLTTNDAVIVDENIVSGLALLLEIQEPEVVNRSFLCTVSGIIWEMLGGDN